MSEAQLPTARRGTAGERDALDREMLRGALDEAQKVVGSFSRSSSSSSSTTRPARTSDAAADDAARPPREAVHIPGDPRYAVLGAAASSTYAGDDEATGRRVSDHVAVSTDDKVDRRQRSTDTRGRGGGQGQRQRPRGIEGGAQQAAGDGSRREKTRPAGTPTPTPAAVDPPSTRVEDAWRPDSFTVMGDFEACPHSIRARNLLSKLVRPLVVVQVSMRARNDPRESDAARTWQALYGDSHPNFTSVPRVGVPVALAPHWLPEDELRRLPRDRALFIGGADDLERFVQITAQTRRPE